MELLGLYYDVLIKILEEVEPEDLAALASTSLGFHHFIKGNEKLYKAHYLRNFVSYGLLSMGALFANLRRMIRAENRQTQSQTGLQNFNGWLNAARYSSRRA